MATFRELLGAASVTEFEFTEILKDQTSDGQQMIHFLLKNPIDKVVGSQYLRSSQTGQSVRVEVTNVEKVTVGPEDLEKLFELDEKASADPTGKTKSPFEWTVPGKSGKLKCDMKLDVTKRTSEVRLVSSSLATFGRNQRQAAEETRVSGLLAQIQAAKTKDALPAKVDAAKPESVATT